MLSEFEETEFENATKIENTTVEETKEKKKTN